MILFIICFNALLFKGTSANNAVPVFIIASNNTFSNSPIIKDPDPFDKIGTKKFEEIVHEVVKYSDVVLLFIEETFNVEDVSLKDKKGSPYLFLRQSLQQGHTKYFPSVVDPFRMLTQYFTQQPFNTFRLKTHTKFQLMETFKYLYIYFEDKQNETRVDCLRRHDNIIQAVYTNVQNKKKGSVVAFYTGKSNPVSAGNLHFVPIKPIPIPKDLGVMVVSSGALFRFSGVYAVTATRRALFNQLPMIAAETLTRRTMSTRMAYVDFELEFNFSFKEAGWRLDDVVLLEGGEEVGRTRMDIGAPWNMSYVCGEPMVIVNLRDGSVVTISQYQIQPRMRAFHSKTTNQDDVIQDNMEDYELRDDDLNNIGRQVTFGRSKNCGPFFNIPICSTLFVTLICLSILLYGIYSMLCIRCNDRYEDPQGKQLSTQEN